MTIEKAEPGKVTPLAFVGNKGENLIPLISSIELVSNFFSIQVYLPTYLAGKEIKKDVTCCQATYTYLHLRT